MIFNRYLKTVFAAFLCLAIPNIAISQSLPPGYVPPALNPKGQTLAVKPLGNNVYALESSKPPVDNAGFVVGEEGVLVIDAHINKYMADQIIAAVKSVTDKPILYLVNTNGYADHTFGNYVFPKSTTIIAHKLTKIMMSPDMEQKKKRSLGMVGGDATAFDGVEQRLPDITFDNFMEIDLGGTTVELHHFGGGNTPGDTVVYIPSIKAAWTGNLIFGRGSIPFLLDGQTERFVETIKNFGEALDVKIIIPGHGLPTTPAIFARYTDYLTSLEMAVQKAYNDGLTLEQTLANYPLPERFSIPEGLSSTKFYNGLHPFNVQKIYLEKKN